MKRIILSLVVLSCITTACNNEKSMDSANVNMDNEEQQVAYSIGLNVGSNMKAQGLTELDPAVVAAGINDALNDKELKITLEESGAAIQAYTRKIGEKIAEENKLAGETFLKENKTKEGWETTESGLQYKVIKQGEGPLAVPTDRVKVHYEGKHIDGEVFENSRDGGTPAEFNANQVVRGWTETLTMMNAGSVYEIAIPSDIAYGPRGKGANIKPNEALLFTIELLEILEKPDPLKK